MNASARNTEVLQAGHRGAAGGDVHGIFPVVVLPALLICSAVVTDTLLCCCFF
jgi:hypothetical protein